MQENFEVFENKNVDKDTFYSNFKEKLENNHTFPGTYMFKFIIPSANKDMAQLFQVFDNELSSFQEKTSKNKKYTSYTINAAVENADHVIKIYKEASTIEGIVLL